MANFQKNNKVNTLEGNLTNNRIKWSESILKINKENPKEGNEHESKRKTPKRETKIKMGTYQERCHKGGKTWEEIKELWQDRYRWRLACMIMHIK
jgi:hypothetical protein